MAIQFVDSTKIIEKWMGKNRILQNVILSYYRKIVKNEVELAAVRDTDSVLCVGGGYFPCTAILFHQLSGAMVTVIDNDLDAIQTSTKLIEKLGLSGKVKVQYTDGGDASANGFDVVHIAMQVSPKTVVFDHLKTTMMQGAKVLVRTPKNCLKSGYQTFEVDSAAGCVEQPRFSNIERTWVDVA